MNFSEKSLLHRITARYRHNPVFSRMLDITGKPLENKKWVFIIGCYNSGTTLLNEILAGHNDIGGLPDEGVMLTSDLVKPENFGWRRMWWKCEDEMKNSEINRKKSARRIRSHWSHFYEDKPILLEKSISNVCRIPFLTQEFENVHFIHLVRNGYAAAEGIKRKAKIISKNEFDNVKTYPIDLCINQWTKTLDKVDNERPLMKNFLEITYEDLTEKTKETLEEITGFLNIESFSNEYFNKSFSIHEKSSQIKNMNSRSFEKLNEEEISIINEIAGEYLKKRGYQLL